MRMDPGGGVGGLTREVRPTTRESASPGRNRPSVAPWGVDLRAFFTTFGLVFLAELGDKTQLATVGLAATADGRRWLVFAASALALTLSSLLAVLVGDALRGRLDPLLIQRAAAVLFIALGVLLLWQSFRGPPA
jgi:putative Ca2+/H+ antiporter (TMEM165/GDT1 family)